MREKSKSSRKTVTIFQDLNNGIQKNQKIGKLHKYTNSMQLLTSEVNFIPGKNTLKASPKKVYKRTKKGYKKSGVNGYSEKLESIP
jgi:hypothetical protein